jgi:beta-lactam-binding protein with PASTA domain
LRRAGLVPVPALTANASVPNRVVIGEAPPAGSTVGKGTHVTISVSTGPGSSALPDVAGLTAAQATAKLKSAGFKPTIEAQSSATVADGRVIATEPAAETEVKAGASVKVFVSSGPAPISVPDVVGQSRAAAEASLTNAKLAVGTITQKQTSEPSPGTVLEQSPTAGSSLAAGEKVDLTVAQAPKEVAVPNVVGAAKAAASSALEHAGFKVKQVPRTTSEQTQKGVVLEQSPAAGTHAGKGATVTIEVGELATTTTTTTPTTPATPTPPAASG